MNPVLGMDNEETRAISEDSGTVSGGGGTEQQDEKQESAQEVHMSEKEEKSQVVSDDSNIDNAVAVAALHSGNDASTTNAPPCAETDQDTKTKLAINQIPTDIHKRSTFANTYHEFPFTLGAHKAFLKDFQDRWGIGCLRHDYFSATSKIIIRRTTVLHSVFAWNVGDHVANALRIRKYHPEILIADVAAQIKKRTDSAVELAANGSWCSPDVGFAHVDAYYPGVVFDISYAQQKMAFGEFAQAYIQGSNGEIQVVVAFEIEYPAAKQAKYYVWKKKVASDGEIQAELVDEEEFQKADGTVNKDCRGIHLSLADFCPARMIPEEAKPLLNLPTCLGHDTGIHIPASELCFLLDIAVRNHQLMQTHLQTQA
ncbi:hypothetical protein Z517_09013 [Fonsecaea pedrosoi CBS 271.37]|uniref:Uncharacterized protein n=1 Tax=Fonsecaea pedrosoi CBS 271.37 TaxID=1442368 RepID=A0A0D2GW56_9EURO|nr:uncharacterized protein Z517_09013 [Fonsecaea pedrosoi CBS 271.37]KIW76569.1 hypothetical protein Z517_09013 [Fonsecaea pedrosoi CBS 271.37]